MKTLLILRHAKSSWDDPGLDDHDRPLAPRGLRDAPRMGRLIVEQDLVPDRILSSTAARAAATAELVADEWGEAVEIETTRELYLASPRGYVEVIAELGGGSERLMVVGHNPGIEALVTLLTGASEKMPTAALAVAELDVETWDELASAPRGSLVGHWRPKALD